MSISFDKALGVHPSALQLRMARAELLAANLANVDTPNYQARDIDFSAELQRSQMSMAFSASPDVKYRIPYQASADGNTVTLDVEQAEFSKNSMDYQTSLAFLNAKIMGLKKAIEGK